MSTFGYANVGRDGQNVNYDEGELVGEVKVRYRIHHDRSYARQSSAVAEVWSPGDLRWNEAAAYGYEQWAADRLYDGTGLTEGAEEALGELKARVRALLEG